MEGQLNNQASLEKFAAYSECFNSKAGKIVLEDLKRTLGIEDSIRCDEFDSGRKAAYWKIFGTVKMADLILAKVK